jgi:serine/threonine protein kinase
VSDVDPDAAATPVDVDAARMELDVARESIRGALFPRFKQVRMLGRYELRRRLGDGGMGIVFAAHDPQLDREIAIKIVRPVRDEGQGHARLLAEARAAARLSHPNVVAIHDVGEHDGQVFVAMELVRGVSLRTWLQDERSPFDIVSVFSQAGAGLAAAHDAGLVHRDFKPGNVLVGDDGRVRVVDFGLAKASTSETSATPDPELLATTSHTMTGTLTGTPAYMAPEQWIGGVVDARADQFAFCVALFEALFGSHPFGGDSWIEIREATLGAPLVFPAGTARAADDLRAVLERGLARRREDRHADMHAVLAALASALPATDRVDAITDVDSPVPSTHASTYLAALPDRLASFPECRIDAALVRLACLRASLRSELLDEMRESHDLSHAQWIPEVCGRAVFATIADRLDGGLAAYQLFVRSTIRARLTSGFVRFLLPPPDSARTCDVLPRAWSMLHRGTSLVVTDARRGHASIVLQHPPALFDALGYTDAIQTLHAALEHCGARVVDVELTTVERGRVQAEIRWG